MDRRTRAGAAAQSLARTSREGARIGHRGIAVPCSRGIWSASHLAFPGPRTSWQTGCARGPWVGFGRNSRFGDTSCAGHVVRRGVVSPTLHCKPGAQRDRSTVYAARCGTDKMATSRLPSRQVPAATVGESTGGAKRWIKIGRISFDILPIIYLLLFR